MYGFASSNIDHVILAALQFYDMNATETNNKVEYDNMSAANQTKKVGKP